MQLNIFTKLWLLVLCCHQRKIQKTSHFCHFNDNNFGSKHYKQKKDPIFLIYPLSSIHWYISLFHFKTLKIQFPCLNPTSLLHHVLVCKIYIYMPKMRLSYLLTWFWHRNMFSYRNFFIVWYITCFGPNLIPTWP